MRRIYSPFLFLSNFDRYEAIHGTWHLTLLPYVGSLLLSPRVSFVAILFFCILSISLTIIEILFVYTLFSCLFFVFAIAREAAAISVSVFRLLFGGSTSLTLFAGYEFGRSIWLVAKRVVEMSLALDQRLRCRHRERLFRARRGACCCW